MAVKPAAGVPLLAFVPGLSAVAALCSGAAALARDSATRNQTFMLSTRAGTGQ